MNYRQLVEHTVSDRGRHLGNVALGLTGEAGEVADLIKKIYYQDHPLDRDKLIKELGDLRWYLELACIMLGTDLEYIERVNTEKLLARYPNGFTTEKSLNRTEE